MIKEVSYFDIKVFKQKMMYFMYKHSHNLYKYSPLTCNFNAVEIVFI